MSNLVYGISIVILWICIALNIRAMIRCNRLSNEYVHAVTILTKAKDNYNCTARKFNDALKELETSGIEAANAVLNREEGAAE